MATAFVFPGQGAQAVGMLDSVAERAAVSRLIEQADRALGEPLSRLIAQGPADTLGLTTNTQPAMLLAGLAFLTAWRADGGPEPDFVAGHSLGEYTALVAAGALQADAAFPLVRARAQAMQDAVPVGEGGMAAILGLSDEQVAQACRQAIDDPAGQGRELVEAVNFNAPAQVVVAGHKAAVERACVAAKALGARRALPLPVSAPFHSRLLEPAGRVLANVLQGVQMQTPRVPLVNNVDVAIETDPDRIRDALVRQAYSPVRWVECVRLLAQRGVTRVVEFGPGKVLSGLIGRIEPAMEAICVHDADSLARALDAHR